MDKQQIRKTFNWEDENSYKWVIKAPGNVGLTVFFTLLYLIFIPTIIYSLLYLIGLLSIILFIFLKATYSQITDIQTDL